MTATGGDRPLGRDITWLVVWLVIVVVGARSGWAWFGLGFAVRGLVQTWEHRAGRSSDA